MDTWTAIAAAWNHTVALKSDGSLWGWGANNWGNLGNVYSGDALNPIQESTMSTNWSSIAAAKDYTAALKSAGTLWAWGNNSFGQLGDGTLTHRSTPTQIGSATDWTTIAAGASHTVALK